MADFTRRAIIATFIELLNDKPLDKITVTEIARRCGISRNTFYYHYDDIYALLEEMFHEETERIVGLPSTDEDLRAMFLEGTAFARENSRAIYHLFNSANRARLERYFHDVTHLVVERFLARQARGMDVPDFVLDDIAFLYAAGLQGAILEWLHDGMSRDAETYIDSIFHLLSGTTHGILERAESRSQ